jgi:hypothetical protein
MKATEEVKFKEYQQFTEEVFKTWQVQPDDKVAA